ncbi:DUF2262 domain-containing protein [Chitinimonas lacunae]|uniref:DUF2262 domain-containing protein n=1 Tax=Chitinimonas lacunae TaxID=1963018 RepID=A0ABV8MLG8_9NEIS
MADDFFSEAQQKALALAQQFDRESPVTITAVVGASGPSGGKAPAEQEWTLRFDLIAWKVDDGPLHQGLLKVCKKVGDAELRQFQQALKPESLIRLTVKLAEENPFGTPQALLLSLDGEAHDAALQSVLDEYVKPCTLDDPDFGTLILDRRLDWFETQADWRGQAVKLRIGVEDLSETAAAIATARTLWRDMATWSERIRQFAVESLLPLKNDSWLDDDEDEVTAAEFLQKMALIAITVYPDQHFEFWHRDGDLFWGHAILVSGSIEEGPTEADIPG